MLIKKITNHLFDVFVGEGWEQWTRFQRNGSSLKMVAGQPLSHDNMTALRNVFQKKDK